MKINKEDFSFFLPPSLIATEPANPRGASRLLALHQGAGVSHHQFEQINQLLPPNCLILINNTKVIPARLLGNRSTGARLEVLLVKEINPNLWACKVKNSAKLKLGEEITLADGSLKAQVINKVEGLCHLIFETNDLNQSLAQLGLPPLPPYILQARQSPGDRNKDLEDYQTCYAQNTGAIAAPTAGLHFTPSLMEQLTQAGHEFCPITLHVGLGTFEPLTPTHLEEKKLHEEAYFISPEAADQINQAKAQGQKVVVVGTTSLRALEAATHQGQVTAGPGVTDIFITPPHKFIIPDYLLTNFHLPASSLLMLVCAFGGTEPVLQAYQQAIEQHYRFYSFGDCMLVPKIP